MINLPEFKIQSAEATYPVKTLLTLVATFLLGLAACSGGPTPTTIAPTASPAPANATAVPGETPLLTTPPQATSSPPEATLKKKNVVLGMVLPLSGFAAEWGIGVLRGAQLAVEDINARGGVTAGGANYTFSISSYDSKLNPATALSLMERAVEEDGARHTFIFHELTQNAVKNYTRDQGVTLLSLGISHVSDEYPLQFRAVYSPESIIDVFLRQASATYPGASRLGLISPDFGAYRFANSLSKEAAAAHGYQTAGEEYFAIGATDVEPAMQSLLDQDPDLILLNADPASAYRLLSAGQDLGYSGAYMYTIPLELENVDVAAPGIRNLMLSHAPESSWPPEVAEFKERYLAKYGGDFSWIAADLAHVADIIIDGIRKAGTDDPMAVAEALKTQKITSKVWGDVSGWGEQVGEFNGYLNHGIPISVYSEGTLDFLGFSKP